MGHPTLLRYIYSAYARYDFEKLIAKRKYYYFKKTVSDTLQIYSEEDPINAVFFDRPIFLSVPTWHCFK